MMCDCMCRYEAERRAFEEERSSWQQELGVARQEVLEQNDRLTLLSQQLTGTKARTSVGVSSSLFTLSMVPLIAASPRGEDERAGIAEDRLRGGETVPAGGQSSGLRG